MKRMLHKAISILREERGETLFESVVSILVFTILIVTVSMVILVSMAVTSSANNWSRIMQGSASAAMTGDTVVLQQDDGEREIEAKEPRDDVIVFSAQFSSDVDPAPVETFSVQVTVNESEEQLELGTFTFMAFDFKYPPPPPPGP